MILYTLYILYVYDLFHILGSFEKLWIHEMSVRVCIFRVNEYCNPSHLLLLTPSCAILPPETSVCMNDLLSHPS
jgi:hypothetical protein